MELQEMQVLLDKASINFPTQEQFFFSNLVNYLTLAVSCVKFKENFNFKLHESRLFIMQS